jgi:hypothetical protein
MTDLEARAREILATDPRLVDALAAIGITIRPRLPGERGTEWSSTWVDTATGEPIAVVNSATREPWEFLHWLAGTEPLP